MDIQYPKLNTSPAASRNYLDNVPANLGDVLMEELTGAARFGVDALNTLGVRAESVFETETLTPDEYANSEYFREGIEVPEEGMKLSIAKITADAYDRRYQRNLTLDRAEQTLGTGALRFGAGFVGSVFDPVNIGLGILAPVAIGANATARAASARAVSGITKRYGVGTGRAAAGAGEGVVGALAFEPLAMGAANIVQDPEYGMFDAFVNVAAGAVFGGALAGIGGKFSDRIKNARRETQVEATRAAIAQTIRGEPVDVDAPIISKDPEIGRDEAIQKAQAERAAYERLMQAEENAKPKRRAKPRATDYPPLIQRVYKKDSKGNPKKPETITAFVRRQGRINTKIKGVGEAGDFEQRLDGISFSLKNNTTGLSLEEMANRAQTEGFFGSEHVNFEYGELGAQRLIQALEDDSFGGGVYSGIDPDVKAFNDAMEIAEEAERLNIDPYGMTDEELVDEIARRRDALDDVELSELEPAEMTGLSREDAKALIHSQRVEPDPDDPSTYNDNTVAFDYIEEVPEEFVTGETAQANVKRSADTNSEISALDNDISKMQKTITALQANDAISEEELIALTELDSFINDYEGMEEVMNTGASCLLRRQ